MPFALCGVASLRPSACRRATVSPSRPSGASLGLEPRNGRCSIASQLLDQVNRSSGCDLYTETCRSQISAPDSASLTRIIPSRWPVVKCERWLTLDSTTFHRNAPHRRRIPRPNIVRCGEVIHSACRPSKRPEFCWLRYLYSKPHDW
jgi:hypothetical protein